VNDEWDRMRKDKAVASFEGTTQCNIVVIIMLR
jgi:hypothetical protein